MGIFGVVLGVILGALLHLIVKIPSLYQAGFRYKPIVDFKEEQMRKIFRLMTPRVLSAGVSQINLIIMTALASFLGAGAISIFNFANNLQAMPQKIIALSIATVAFPGLAQNFASERKSEFSKIFWYSFKKIFFLVGPIALFFFLFSEPIVKIILMTGKFSLASAQLTGAVLRIFSISIIFNALYFLIVRAFFAFHDTKTPTLVTFLTVILNLILALFFISYLFVGEKKILGLALAFTISSIFEFCLLFLLLRKRFQEL
jgi:putative peptidoglycan lipid II flippase